MSLPRYITAIRSDTWRTTRQVVGDEQVGEAEVVLEVVEQVDDLRLHRHVERRHRLVEHDQARLERERARDADALALAARELVRVAVEVLGLRGPRARAARARASLDARRARRRAAAAAAPMIWPTRLRGLSDANGSWKTICISRRSGSQLLARRRA